MTMLLFMFDHVFSCLAAANHQLVVPNKVINFVWKQSAYLSILLNLAKFSVYLK